MSERSLFRRLLAPTFAISTLAGMAVAAYARFVHPYRLRVTQLLLPLPRRHAHLDGLRIAFVSDTHIGPVFRATDLQPVINALRREKPDILLLGGDYISESPRYIDEVIPAIADMAATARFGTYAVLGNHDISNIRTRVSKPLRELGIPVLENESIRVETDRGDLWIAGVDDSLMGVPDIAAAFRDVPSDAPSIVLWHVPDDAERAAEYGPLLQLSGHTHGGQVRLPLLGPLALPKLGRTFPSGKYVLGDMVLYVGNGIGMYRPPVRLNCPPELVFVRFLA